MTEPTTRYTSQDGPEEILRECWSRGYEPLRTHLTLMNANYTVSLEDISRRFALYDQEIEDPNAIRMIPPRVSSLASGVTTGLRSMRREPTLEEMEHEIREQVRDQGEVMRERPALVKQIDEYNMSHGMTREEAEAQTDRTGAEIYHRAFGKPQLTDERGLVAFAQQEQTAAMRDMVDNVALSGVGTMTRGQRVQREKRVSVVYKQSDAPAGTRKRGWGWLHDQIWFHVTEQEVMSAYYYHKMDPEFEPTVLRRDVETPEDGKELVFADTKIYKWDSREGSWMRLYMDRKMLWLPRWLASLRLRLHTFYSGDDDSAPHDHPWDFVTFPLGTYHEVVQLLERKTRKPTRYRTTRKVRAFVPHWRPAEYIHYVLEPERPFRTLVVARGKERDWGFWPESDKFVSNKEWTRYTS